MNTRLANALIHVFHPVLLNLYIGLFVILTNSLTGNYFSQTLYISLVFLLGYFVLPLFTVYLIKREVNISAVFFPSKQNKALVYLIFALYYYATFRMMVYIGMQPIVNLTLLMLLLIFVVQLILHLVFEINFHAFFIGACMGSLLGFGYKMNLNYLYVILILLFISAWVFSAQLILKKYNLLQIYTPFLTGIFGFILLFFFIL